MTTPTPPTNITRVFVAGYFTDSNDLATAGKLVITPDFTRGVNDAWKRIVMAAPTSSEPSETTGLAYVSVVAGDDPDLNPSNFTHTVVEPGGRKYQIFVPQATPVWTADTPGHPLDGQRVLWLNTVAPSDTASSGVVQVVAGPQGPPGEVSAAQLATGLATKMDKPSGTAAVGTLPAVVDASPLTHAYVEYFKVLAAQLDPLIVGTITRNANGAATGAGVVWPDGRPGVYTATTLSTAFPGAVDAYTITYDAPGSDPDLTFTQPAVTRDSTTGAVTARPAVTVA